MIAARVEHRYGCGDHTLYVGEVQQLAVNDPAAPLLFYAGKLRDARAASASPGPAPEPYPSFF